MRETIIINSRLAWRLARGDAAAKRSHGLQVLSIEHLAARLAGGFLQVIDSDTLKDAIAKALAADLGELNGIKELPGFPLRRRHNTAEGLDRGHRPYNGSRHTGSGRCPPPTGHRPARSRGPGAHTSLNAAAI